jgi:hypothetical protein
MEAQETLTKREYGIAPAMRRSCWYIMLSAAPMAGVICYVSRIVGRQDLSVVMQQMAIFAILFVGAMLGLRWKLCLDSEGISRWRALFWDKWTWSDFASGRIQKPGPGALYDPARPLGRRALNVGWLAGDDLREVLAAINVHYRLPPPPEVADRLAIKWGTFYRNRAALDDGGIDLLVQGRSAFHAWSEVRRVSIVRSDPLRRDFRFMQIEIDGKEIEWKVISGHPNWQGATAEQLNEYCLKRIPPERVAISTEYERADRSYTRSKLRDAEQLLRASTICTAICLPALIVSLGFMAIACGVLKASIMAAFTLITIGPIYAATRVSARKRIKELRQELESL